MHIAHAFFDRRSDERSISGHVDGGSLVHNVLLKEQLAGIVKHMQIGGLFPFFVWKSRVERYRGDDRAVLRRVKGIGLDAYVQYAVKRITKLLCLGL
ncbi:hypothetical protein SDC9_139490 [bioreactor metagenome]|uniref:Uncharacterized protein n=1 Tax=bioreactor metagenome TaxID=1076179 RepID=A0A645DSV6_9ZZZZ